MTVMVRKAVDTATNGDGKKPPAQGKGVLKPDDEEDTTMKAKEDDKATCKDEGTTEDVNKPYPNEYAARVRDPKDFLPDTMRSKEITDGVRIIIGKVEENGPMVTQAYRFDKDKWTADEAKKWLENHDVKAVSFEEATNKASSTDAEDTALEIVFPIMKRNEMKRVVTGMVLKPDVVDAQEEVISADEIEKTAYGFMLDYRTGPDGSVVGYMHKEMGRPLAVVESYVAPVDFELNGTTVPQGAWVLSVKVLDDDVWNEVLANKIRGFSIGGYATKTEIKETA